MKFPKLLATYAPKLHQGLEWLRIRIEKIIAPIFPPPEPISNEDRSYSDKLADLVEGRQKHLLNKLYLNLVRFRLESYYI